MRILPRQTHDVAQPKEWLETEGGICVRMIYLEKAGYVVPQHTHEYGHTTLISSGAAALWVDGAWQGDFVAPCLRYVQPNAEHVYQALADNTVLSCISRQE